MQNNMPEQRKSEGSSGPVVGIIIVIIIIILGGLYIWGGSSYRDEIPEINTDILNPEEIDSVMEAEKEISELRDQNNSDEINAIEEDLNNTDLENLDAELDDLENETNS